MFIRLRFPQHDCALYKDESSISRDASSKQGEPARRALPLPPSETFQSSLIKNSSLSNSPLIPAPHEQSFCILNSGNTFQTERGQTLPREQWWQHAFWSLASMIGKAERSWRLWTNKISRLIRMEPTVGTLSIAIPYPYLYSAQLQIVCSVIYECNDLLACILTETTCKCTFPLSFTISI